MKKIFVVFGSTGEYEDYREWNVRAFLNKKQAEKFAIDCQQLYDEQTKNVNFNKYAFINCNWKHPLDSNFQTDYNGTKYYISEVPLQI